MSRPIAEPLRSLTAEEREGLLAVTRCPSQPQQRHQRAAALLAVAEGATLTAAAARVGWRVCDTVAALIRRFNRVGMAALDDRPRSGRRRRYTERDEARILAEFRRPPDRERDGTATWSLSTLRRALREAPDGLPEVSTFTLHQVLHGAGCTWQRDRSWCETGVVLRKRKSGVARVADPEAAEKRG
jgi:transposase